jgi:DNA-directed RNA polymerase subunit RPC12/RpoP
MIPSPEAAAAADAMLYRVFKCPGCKRTVRHKRRVGMPPQRCTECRAKRLLKQRRKASYRFYHKNKKRAGKSSASKRRKVNG